jgi:hypothetical protein
MINYKDLIYYKQDVIDSYKEKRKGLSKEDIEDLLNCAVLFLEASAKENKLSAIEIPNIGYLHKKVDFIELNSTSTAISNSDRDFVKSAYINTRFSPLVTRKDLLFSYYPNTTLEELQKIQNDK